MEDSPIYSEKQEKACMPRWVGVVVYGLVALILLHLAVPLIMFLLRDELRRETAAAQPSLTPELLGYAVLVTLIVSLVFHLIFVALYAWLAVKIRAGRNWARVTLSVVLVVATVASVTSFVSSPMFRVLIPFTDVLQLVFIGLLWFPPSSRAHFAKRALH